MEKLPIKKLKNQHAKVATRNMIIIVFLSLATVLFSFIDMKRNSKKNLALKVVGISVFLVLIYQFLAYIHQGYVDPFFVIAIVVQLVSLISLGFFVVLLKRFFIGNLPKFSGK